MTEHDCRRGLREEATVAVRTTAISLLVAAALVEIAWGPYNAFLNTELSLDFVADPALLGLMRNVCSIDASAA